MQPNLPQELIDYIIDILHDDGDSLAQCALVCSSWLNRCRCHMFHEICAYPAIDARDDSKAMPDIRALLTLLQKAPDVQQHVICLRIKSPESGAQIMGMSDLMNLLELLPQLQRLRLEGVQLFSDQDSFNRLSLVQGSYSLDTLVVMYCTPLSSKRTNRCSSAQSLGDILSLFTNIDTLSVFHCFAPYTIDPAPIAIPNRCRVRRLCTLFPVSYDPILDAVLEGAIKTEDITHVTCKLNSARNLAMVNRFLGALSSTVVQDFELDLRDCDHYTVETTWETLEVPFTNLKSLRLHLSMRRSSKDKLVWDSIISLLSQMLTTSLETLFIHLHIVPPSIYAEGSGDPQNVARRMMYLDWVSFLRRSRSIPTLRAISFYLGFRDTFNPRYDVESDGQPFSSNDFDRIHNFIEQQWNDGGWKDNIVIKLTHRNNHRETLDVW